MCVISSASATNARERERESRQVSESMKPKARHPVKVAHCSVYNFRVRGGITDAIARSNAKTRM